MTQGLSVTDVVNVQIVIGPVAVQTRNFGSLLIIGSTPGVIDTNERKRKYTTLPAVAGDFGIMSPEYLAADIYFSQQPQPQFVYIGFFAQNASQGVLHGGYLPAAAQFMSNYNSITNGTFAVSVDGINRPVTGLNFAACTNLSMVAANINTTIQAYASCTWDGKRFNIMSNSTGTNSTVGYATPQGTGTDISPLLYLNSALALSPVGGIGVESPLQVLQLFANMSNDWYGVTFAPVTPLTDLQVLNNAAFIEGCTPSRIYGHTTQNPAELAQPNTTSLGAQLKSLLYARTFLAFSSSNPYAVVGIPAIAFVVDWTGSKTALTIKFKQIIGVAPENLSESQAQALKANNINVFVNYDNGAAIIQEGQMVGGRFFDEVHGLDWLQNYVQTGQFNLLYTTKTKIPQTDSGVTTQLTQLEKDLGQGVRNGFMAPGVWNAGGFGQLSQGDTLPKGFYTYGPPIAQQSQGDREARLGVTIQAAIKLAGAVHFSNVILNVNR